MILLNLRVDAQVKNISEITEKIDALLEQLECPFKAQTQIDVAIDEVFSNIAIHAYAQQGGPVRIICDMDEDSRMFSLCFIDQGPQYDPLQASQPDITASAEERSVGGLGIFILRKFMDDIRYEYAGGENKLTLIKKL